MSAVALLVNGITSVVSTRAHSDVRDYDDVLLFVRCTTVISEA